QRVAATGVHPLLRGLRETVQRQVARGDLVPGAGDADLRLDPVIVAHPDGAQHAARDGGAQTVGDLAAAGLDVGGREGGVGGGGSSTARWRRWVAALPRPARPVRLT